MPHIVLASQSPRRQALLRQMGIADFSVVVPQADETCPAGLSPEETVVQIACRKGDAAAKRCAADNVVIAADTMVFLDAQRLGKPTSPADALRMLTALNGRRHTVCTGVCVRQGAVCERFCVSAEVTFRTCTQEELRAYVATGEPLDKAGAYGIQGRGALLIERIDGDYYTVVGLPIARLGSVLSSRFGVPPFGGERIAAP